MTEEEKRYWREHRSAIVQFASAAVTGLLTHPGLSEHEVARVAWEVAGRLMGRWEQCQWPDLTPQRRVKREPEADEVAALRLELATLRQYVEAIRNE